MENMNSKMKQKVEDIWQTANLAYLLGHFRSKEKAYRNSMRNELGHTFYLENYVINVTFKTNK